MRRRIFSFILLAVTALGAMAQSNTMTPGQAYYLYNKYYKRVLSSGASAGDAKLSAIGTNDEAAYVFDCEQSTTDGFFYLKHRSSGQYFAAIKKDGNTWGTVLTVTKDNDALWRANDGRLTCKKNTSKYLGIDTGQESQKYISVFYDKDANDRSAWRFIKVVDGGYEASVKAADDEDAAIEELKRNSLVLLTGNTLGLEDSYTVGFNEVALSGDDVHSTILLRNKGGKGVSFDLYSNRITLDGKSYKFTASSTMSLLITSNNGNITIKCNGDQVATTTATTVAAVTNAGTDCELSIVNAANLSSYMPVIYSRTKVVEAGTFGSDKLGHKTLEVVCLNNARSLEVSSNVDVHVLSGTPFTGSCKVSIIGDRSRLIFDNCRPSDVKKQLSNVIVNGNAATVDNNCRVGIYLNGTVIFAKPANILEGYYGEQYTGKKITLSTTGNINLGKQSNEMRSFILRRGYMATLASDEGQGGYTRVYVADHEDLLVPVLPDALNRRVSSVHIKQWNYVSKRGWCATSGHATKGSSVEGNMRSINATWYYNWDANNYKNDDVEYIPIRQHIWWPSVSTIKNHGSSTACLLMNEPEHSEQHNNCDCKGAINAWTACTKTPEMSNMGMRVGSPAPTDMGWLYEYIGHVDDMAYRCDFVAIHAYWGTNEAANAQAWKNRLTEIYNKTHRPIWITEWNNGASWTNEWWPSSYGDKIEQNRKAIKEIVAMLESLDFVERYSIYNWDGGQPRYVINPDDSWVTPAGQAYRDQPSTFAYNAKVQPVPNWWAPSLKSISMTISKSGNDMTFNIDNPNVDMTDKLVIEMQQEDGTWKEVYSFDERYLFDGNKLTATLPDAQEGMYRARLTTLKGATTTSSHITNHDCHDGTNGWTVNNVSNNKGEAADGNKDNVYWDKWDPKPYTSTMTQEVTGLPSGYYTLTAQLRCQSHMTMTLSLSSSNGSAAKTFQGNDSKPVDGSPYPMGWQDVTTGEVLCKDGTLTITLTAVNPSNAGWWSADNFSLTFRPEPKIPVGMTGIEAVTSAPAFDLSGRPASAHLRGIVIKGNKKYLRK